MNDYHTNLTNKVTGVIIWQGQAHRIKIVKSRLYFDVIAACLHEAVATQDEADACGDKGRAKALRDTAAKLRGWATQPDNTVTDEPRYRHLRARQIWPHRITGANLALYLSLVISASEQATEDEGYSFFINADLHTPTVWAIDECKEVAWFVGSDMLGYVVTMEEIAALITASTKRLRR